MSLFINPLSEVKVTPYSTTITTANLGIVAPSYPLSPTIIAPNVFVPTGFQMIPLQIETGLNENPFAQKQMLDYIMAKVYNKWIYSKDMCYLLKYLKVANNKVHFLSSIDEYKNNKICDDTENDVELKIDFIEQNILTKSDLKKLLKRMIDELNFKWYEFPEKIDIVQDVVEKYIKKSLKEGMGSAI